MDRKKTLLYVSAAAALGLGILFVHLGERLNTERARAESEASQRREAQERLERLERQLVATIHTPADVPAPRSSEAATRQASPPADEESEREVKSVADPGGREVVEAARKAEVRARNPDMAREIGLSDEEYEQLLDLMITLQRTSVPIDEQSRQVAAFLGEEKAARFEDYKESLPLRWQVRAFQSRLTEASALTDAQITRLTAALQSARKRFAEEFAASGAAHLRIGSNGAGTSAEEYVLAQLDRYEQYARHNAGNLLTSQQWREYERFRSNERARLRLNLQQMLASRPGD